MDKLSTDNIRRKVSDRYPMSKSKDMTHEEKEEIRDKREKYRRQLEDEKAEYLENEQYRSDAHDDLAQ